MSDKLSDIQDFWTRSPQTYSEDVHGGRLFQGRELEYGTREFFENVDRKFIGRSTHMHSDRPFGAVFPFERYAKSQVLEVGCGMGVMAMQWAKNGSNFTGIDLSPMSVAMSSQRFQLFGYPGSFVLGDARKLPFADGSFDFAYSWGVLHHSPDLAQSLREVMRVIRPGGEFAMMLYNRDSLLYRYFIQFRQGFLNMESKFLDPLELASRYTDDFETEGNPHTWPVRKPEIREILRPYTKDLRFWIHGTDVSSHLDHLIPVLGSRLPAWALKPWARRFGWSLCFAGRRR